MRYLITVLLSLAVSSAASAQAKISFELVTIDGAPRIIYAIELDASDAFFLCDPGYSSLRCGEFPGVCEDGAADTQALPVAKDQGEAARQIMLCMGMLTDDECSAHVADVCGDKALAETACQCVADPCTPGEKAACKGTSLRVAICPSPAQVFPTQEGCWAAGAERLKDSLVSLILGGRQKSQREKAAPAHKPPVDAQIVLPEVPQ